MVVLFKSLTQFNSVRFSAYRTAMKLRDVQKKLGRKSLFLSVSLFSSCLSPTLLFLPKGKKRKRILRLCKFNSGTCVRSKQKTTKTETRLSFPSRFPSPFLHFIHRDSVENTAKPTTNRNGVLFFSLPV